MNSQSNRATSWAGFAVAAFAITAVTMAHSISAAPARRTAKSSIVRPDATAEKLTTRALVAGKIPGVQYRRNVTYLPADRTEKLDVYLPQTTSTAASTTTAAHALRPAIVMIHGGGWVGGNKDATRELQAGVAFARAGYVTVSVEYFKDRGHAWPVNLQDCKNAVRWVRSHAAELNVDPDRIGVIGGSAGGHLALMVAYTGDMPELDPDTPYPGISDRVIACVDLYGISDLLTRQGADKSGKPNLELRTKMALFPESREQDLAKWKLASPVTHITSSTPPTLIIHGTADTTVDRDQSKELASRLKKAGVDNKLLLIPGAGHAFILNDPRLKNDLRPEVIGFFDKYLKEH